MTIRDTQPRSSAAAPTFGAWLPEPLGGPVGAWQQALQLGARLGGLRLEPADWAANPSATTQKSTGLTYDRAGPHDDHRPPMLLVHGLGSCRRIWRSVAATLALQHDVIAVDLPGHAGLPVGIDQSPMGLARTLAAFLDELGIDRVHVVGHSLGGWTALELGADGRAASITGLASAGLPYQPATKRSALLWANLELATRLAPLVPVLVRPTALRALTMTTGTTRPAELPYVDAVVAALAHQQASGFLATLDATLNTVFKRAAAIDATVPVTVLICERDAVLPPEHHDDPLKAPPHTMWVRLGGSGHAPLWDAPKQVLQAIGDTVVRAST